MVTVLYFLACFAFLLEAGGMDADWLFQRMVDED